MASYCENILDIYDKNKELLRPQHEGRFGRRFFFLLLEETDKFEFIQ